MNKLYCLLYLFVFITCVFISAKSEKLAVVLSRTAAAYEAAKNGILWNCGYDVDVFNMEGDRFKGERMMKKFEARYHKAVIAIGNERYMVQVKGCNFRMRSL